MADPLTILGGLASVAQVINGVSGLVKSLHEIRESYSNVALNITLVSSQLTTVRAALEALQVWRDSDTTETEASKQLDKDLDLSLSCCAILITVINGKLVESGYTSEEGWKQKIKYVWLEDTLKEYVSNLEGQVRALQLLLTIFQCRTVTEQKQQLARRESRIIIEQICSETMSLSLREGEMDDAMSILSQDPSVHLEVDSILMRSPAYRRVYGEKPPRRGDPPIPFPNPSIRRKPLQTSPPLPSTSSTLVHAPLNTDRPTNAQPASPPPQTIPPRPPPVPPRPKGPRRTRPTLRAENSQMRTSSPYSEGGDPPFSTEEASGQKQIAVNPARSDPAASREVPIALDQHRSTAVSSTLTSATQSAEEDIRSPSDHTQAQQTWPTVQSLQEERDPAIEGKVLATSANQPKFGAPQAQQPQTLESFKTEIDMAFGDSGPSRNNDGNPALRLSFQESSETVSNSTENVAVGRNDNGQTLQATTEEKEDVESEDQLLHEANRESIYTPKPLESADKSTSLQSTSDPRNSEEPIPAASSQDFPGQRRPESTTDDSDMEFVTDMDGFPIFDRQWAAMYRKSRLIGPSTKPDVSSGKGQLSSSEDAKGQVNRSCVGQADVRAFSDEAEVRAATDLIPSKDFVVERPSELESSGQVVQPGKVQFSSEPPSTPFIVLLRPPNNEPTALNSKAETSTLSSSGRNSHPYTPSTTSSYENTASNTTLTFNNTTTNTIATSTSIDGPAAIRDSAQAELKRLQEELMAAKARGDSRKAQESLQQSIDIVRRSYLEMPQTQAKTPLYPKDGASLKRFMSLVGSSSGSALNDAAASGDLARVKALLDARANVDGRGKTMMTSLMLAAVGGHPEIMEELKNHGADEFAVDAKGRTVLHLAVASRRLSAVEWLLYTYPPQLPEPIKRRSSLFFRATDSIRGRAPKNLRESSDLEGSKPLHVAVDTNTGEMVETLLAAGVEIDSRNNRGRTPLHQAIIADRREAFSMLLQSGADFNAMDARAMSALHWAANTGRVEMVETLLARGAQRDAFDDSGNQPIHEAAWMGHLPCIELLARDYKDLEVPTKTGESLLHIACLHSDWGLAAYLLGKNVNANPWARPQSIIVDSLQKSKLPLKSLTPLHYACCKGDYEMAILFLDNGAWINAATPEGVTALMMAVEGENTNLVNLLLTRNAYVNASLPGTLETALHLASRRHDLETVQQLCRAGADFKARTGQTGFAGGGFMTPYGEAYNATSLNAEKKSAVIAYLQMLRRNYA